MTRYSRGLKSFALRKYTRCKKGLQSQNINKPARYKQAGKILKTSLIKVSLPGA